MKLPRMAAPTYPIGSVDNGLKLLDLVARRKRIRVSEAARELGVAQSSAHRLLAMLRYHGFVVQDAHSREYLPGQALLALGMAAAADIDVRTLARPELERLRVALDESAFLVTLHGRMALTIDRVESARTSVGGSETWIVAPAHTIAAGKALLAAMGPDASAALLGGVELETPTPQTIATLADLEAELRRIRARGYATSVDESDPGVSAVAATLPPPLHHLAIGVAGASEHFDEGATARTAGAVLAAARQISDRALAGATPQSSVPA